MHWPARQFWPVGQSPLTTQPTQMPAPLLHTRMPGQSLDDAHGVGAALQWLATQASPVLQSPTLTQSTQKPADLSQT